MFSRGFPSFVKEKLWFVFMGVAEDGLLRLDVDGGNYGNIP